jgi:two-component system, OmpR family, phosphate regulon sensor histidine kinase PhoR
MLWSIIAALLLVAIIALHLSWKKKYLGSLEKKEKELAELRDTRSEKSSQAEAQQKTMLNSMVEGLLLLDNTGRIQLANRALENLFGVSSSIYGKTIIEAFRNYQLAELAERLSAERQILEYEIQLSEIQSRWFQVNAAAITDENGNQNGMIFVFHDLTRLKQLENTRQEFVANVSHELRTPLSMIKGYVETLLDGAKDNPEVATKFLHTIERHADRLTFLIEDLLTISKLESGQIVLNCQPGELRPAIEKVIGDLRAHAAEKHVNLENEVPSTVRAVADFERLEQVLWNLIDNAIKYGQTNGTVVIGARQIENEKVEVWVKDDGPGISPEVQARVFERFYRVDKARSREQGGTGLGLAIVKHVVQCHGGEAWVESESGKGASFHFTLVANHR